MGRDILTGLTVTILRPTLKAPLNMILKAELKIVKICCSENIIEGYYMSYGHFRAGDNFGARFGGT